MKLYNHYTRDKNFQTLLLSFVYLLLHILDIIFDEAMCTIFGIMNKKNIFHEIKSVVCLLLASKEEQEELTMKVINLFY